jgi:DNA-binding transcriptional ArsR family regulator
MFIYYNGYLFKREMVNIDITEKILKALKEEPLYISQISEKTSLSKNTVGKYVDILSTAGKVKVQKYANTKLVSLNTLVSSNHKRLQNE